MGSYRSWLIYDISPCLRRNASAASDGSKRLPGLYGILHDRDLQQLYLPVGIGLVTRGSMLIHCGVRARGKSSAKADGRAQGGHW